MKIGIDVDLTTLKSDDAWWNWLCKMCGGLNSVYTLQEFKEVHGSNISYNLSEYFPRPLNAGVSPFDFWRSTDLYSMIDPVENAVKNIHLLKKDGNEIVFISTIKGHTNKSKWLWLDRYFPFDKAYIATKDKYLINVDVMIDDRINVLNTFDDSVEKILFSTPYTQTETKGDNIIEISQWEDIYGYISKLI